MVPPLQIPHESSMKEDTGSSITQIPLYQPTHELQQPDTVDGKGDVCHPSSPGAEAAVYLACEREPVSSE